MRIIIIYSWEKHDPKIFGWKIYENDTNESDIHRLPTTTDKNSFEITNKNNKLSLLYCTIYEVRAMGPYPLCIYFRCIRARDGKGKSKRLNEKYNLCVWSVEIRTYGITKVIKFDKSQAMTSCVSFFFSTLPFRLSSVRWLFAPKSPYNWLCFIYLQHIYGHHSPIIIYGYNVGGRMEKCQWKPIYNRFGTEHNEHQEPRIVRLSQPK